MRRLLLCFAVLGGLAPRAHAGGADDGTPGAGRPARPLGVPCDLGRERSAWRAASPGDGTPPRDLAPDAGGPESARVATPTPSEGTEAPAEPGAEQPAPTVELGLSTTNRYLYRGFLVEDEGAIVQTWVEVHLPVLAGRGALEQLDLGATAWASLGTGPTGTGGDNDVPRAFSEVDWTLSATARLAGGWSFTAACVWFRYPNGSADPVQEATLAVAFDDAPRWSEAGRFRGFAPTAILGFEGQGQSDGGRHPGVYLGIGAAPRLSLSADPEGASLSFSVTAGFSLSSYYEDAAGRDETFGYVEGGPELELPLGGREGGPSFAVTLGVHVLLAGDHVRAFNATDEPEIVAFLAFRTSF